MARKDASFITEGPIHSVILTISIPLMINNLIRTLYNLTDGLYVAQLSAEDFAATAFIWPLNFLFISLGLGISVGATSLISQFLGAKNQRQAKKYASTTIALMYGLGISLAVIGYFLSPTFVKWMGAEGSFYHKSVAYLKINMLGLFFDFAYYGYQTILNSQGKTKTITIISTISSLSNVILDPIFIFTTIPIVNLAGLGWGIEGAAIATVIAKALLWVFAIVAVNRESLIQIPLKEITCHWGTAQHIFRLGIPAALGSGGAALGFTVLNGLIESYGTATLAAYSMVNRITDLLTQPQMGIGNAMTSIIGQNMGAKKYARAHQLFNQALLFIVIFSVLASVSILLFKQQMLLIFIKDQADQQLWTDAIRYMNYSVFIIFFMGLFSAYTGFFQGCGQTKYSMYMSIGRLWTVRLPIIWILSAYTNLGSTGVWIAMLLSNALTVLYGYMIYRLKDWEHGAGRLVEN